MTAISAAVGRRVGAVVGWGDLLLERRVALALLTVTPIVFVAFLAIAPVVNPTFDDAKYVGVGRNFLAGNGPRNLFGVIFLKHSPLWPIILVLPEKLFGIKAITVGHVIGALSGAASIAMVGALGWRIRPILGAVAAAVFAALPYVFDTARTAGIDLPSIALTLAYILFGFEVVRRGSVRLSIALGALFAVAFLIKETILPFAPVPFLAGIAWGIEWRSLLRTAATTMAVAAIGCSWWFAMYASYMHVVYRADFLPAIALIPIALGIGAFVAVAFLSDWIAERLAARGIGQPQYERLPAAIRARWRPILATVGTLGWFLLLYVVFSRTPKLLGASLLNGDQVAYFIDHALGSVRMAVAFGLGAVFVLIELLRNPSRVSSATRDALIAFVCGIPLVLLVMGVGETPRHYIAELGILIVLGAVGWAAGIERMRERDIPSAVLFVLLAAGAIFIGGPSATIGVGPRSAAALAIGLILLIVVGRWALSRLRARNGLHILAPIAGALVVLLALGSVGARAARLQGGLDASEEAAVAATIDWINTNVQPGQGVALGPYLSMETAIDMPFGTKLVQIRHYLAIFDPSRPLALRSAVGPTDDVIAVDAAPNKANQFDVYSGSLMATMINQYGIDYYVYPVSRARSSQQILGSLTPANGFTEVYTRSYTTRFDTLDVHIYRVDRGALNLGSKTFVSKVALERIVNRLQRDPARATAAARNLLDRIVPPADGSEDALIEQLRALARR
jgi:hypothetical protein